MSLRSTIMLSSRGQMYCCFSLPLHFAWSRLNEIAAWLCVAEKSFTGIDTKPNEIVPEPMERALMGCDDNLLGSMPNFLDERPGRRFAIVRQTGARPGYVLHLETDGVLRSWAVPKAPSPDPADRRLAVEIEAGAGGESEVWDCGRCTAVQDFANGFREGKLLFELAGYKLRGAWTLVRTRGKEWLLIKETKDNFVQRGGSFSDAPVLPTSEAAMGVRREVSASGAPRRKLHAGDIQPMLAEVRQRPFSDPEW